MGLRLISILMGQNFLRQFALTCARTNIRKSDREEMKRYNNSMYTNRITNYFKIKLRNMKKGKNG